MYYTSPSIIISSIPYGESSLIVKAFTKDLGLKTYIVKGVRKTKSKKKAVLFQPLMMLDITWRENDTSNFQTIRDVEISSGFSFFHDHVIKSSLAVFIAEIISHTLLAQEKNENFFSFFAKQINYLSGAKTEFSVFHFHFLAEYIELLGFSPLMNFDEEHKRFDMLEARFVASEPIHKYHLSEVESYHFYKLFSKNDTLQKSIILLNKDSRERLLNILLDYYTIHLPNFRNVKSHKVFSAVFG